MKKNRSLSASRCYLVLIGSLLLLSCSKPPQQAPAMLPAVKVTEVIQDDVAVFEEWVGTLDGMVNATINAQVTGYLIKQNYKEGDLVKKDQLLYEIDPRTFQAALAQAKASLAQQQAVLQTNQLALNRIKRLLPEKAVSVLDRDNAVGAVATANAQVLAAQAAVDTAQLNLGFTKITSPISGIAGVSKTQLGDLVGPGSANNELTTVSQVNPIRAYIGLSESQYLHFVEQKQNSHQESGTVPLELKLADNSVYPHSGKFFFAGRAVDVSTGTIKVAGLFPNTNNVLRPGMYARIRANVSKETGLLVPQVAVMQLQTATQLAVVNKEDKVEIRTVTLGQSSGKLVVVKEGVKLGERVIVEGGQKVRNGMKVQPAPYTATAKAE
ncbi:MAG: efflux RND transporter periplasmic adaptor subunit [Methylococcales bacterium]|nr:efflux RND transporter periplasmic adaptor subunit [Methylococcales bacterium]